MARVAHRDEDGDALARAQPRRERPGPQRQPRAPGVDLAGRPAEVVRVGRLALGGRDRSRDGQPAPRTGAQAQRDDPALAGGQRAQVAGHREAGAAPARRPARADQHRGRGGRAAHPHAAGGPGPPVDHLERPRAGDALPRPGRRAHGHGQVGPPGPCRRDEARRHLDARLRARGGARAGRGGLDGAEAPAGDRDVDVRDDLDPGRAARRDRSEVAGEPGACALGGRRRAQEQPALQEVHQAHPVRRARPVVADRRREGHRGARDDRGRARRHGRGQHRVRADRDIQERRGRASPDGRRGGGVRERAPGRGQLGARAQHEERLIELVERQAERAGHHLPRRRAPRRQVNRGEARRERVRDGDAGRHGRPADVVHRELEDRHGPDRHRAAAVGPLLDEVQVNVGQGGRRGGPARHERDAEENDHSPQHPHPADGTTTQPREPSGSVEGGGRRSVWPTPRQP